MSDIPLSPFDPKNHNQVIQRILRAVDDANQPLQLLLNRDSTQSCNKTKQLQGNLKKRSDRLQEIQDLVEKLPATHPTIGVIGPPGVGKSTLCCELVSRGLPPEIIQMLQERDLTQSGPRGKTQNPIMYEYGDDFYAGPAPVHDNDAMSDTPVYDVIRLPSPILQRCTLIDTAGICSSDAEGYAEVLQNTISLMKSYPLDGIWLLPSWGDRSPDYRGLVTCLTYLYDVGVFHRDPPLLTPFVTFLHNPKEFDRWPEEDQRNPPDFTNVILAALEWMCGMAPNEPGDLPNQLKELLTQDTKLRKVRETLNGSLQSLYRYHRVSCQYFRLSRYRAGDEEEEKKIDECIAKLYDDLVIHRCIGYAQEIYGTINSTKFLVCTSRQDFKNQITKIKRQRCFTILQEHCDALPHIQSKLSLEQKSQKRYVYVRSTTSSPSSHDRWTRTRRVRAPQLRKDSIRDYWRFLRVVLRLRVRRLAEVTTLIWESGESVVTEIRQKMKNPIAREVLESLLSVCRDEIEQIDAKCNETTRQLEECLKNCARIAWRSCSSSSDPLLWIQENFIGAWNKHSKNRAAHADESPFAPLFTAFSAIEADFYAGVKLQLGLINLPVSVDTKVLDEIYKQTRAGEKSLKYFSDLKKQEFRRSTRTTSFQPDLKQRPLLLLEASTRNVTHQRNSSLTPIDPENAYSPDHVSLHFENISTIQCSISVEGRQIRYVVPEQLEQRFMDPYPVVFIPSILRAIPFDDSLYPRLFVDEWREERTGPTIILAVDEEETSQYEAYLHEEQYLWSTNHPERLVVLMSIGSDHPEWGLYIGRKRQMIKTLMDMLYQANQSMAMETYVVCDDDIDRLVTLDEFEKPYKITMSEAIGVLRRTMDHENRQHHGVPREFSDFLGELRTHYRRTPLGGDFADLDEALRDASSMEGPRKELWSGQSTGVLTWNKLEQFVDKLFEVAPPQEYLWTDWNQLLGLHHRVAMTSAMNDQTRFGSAKRSSMSTGAYTHCNSTQMYNFVLYSIASCREINYVHPNDFFTVVSSQRLATIKADLKKECTTKQKEVYQTKASEIGYKHEDRRFGVAAQDSHRLTLMTTLIGLTRTLVPSTFKVTPLKGSQAGGEEDQLPAPADRPAITTNPPRPEPLPVLRRPGKPRDGRTSSDTENEKTLSSSASRSRGQAKSPLQPSGSQETKKRRSKQKKESPKKIFKC